MRILVLVLLVPLFAAAQTVYESKDKAGAVFSDVPSSGSKSMNLPPPNVIQTPQPREESAAPSRRAVPNEPVQSPRARSYDRPLPPVPAAADPVLSPDAVQRAPVLGPDETIPAPARSPD